jgi:hypothetical protein
VFLHLDARSDSEVPSICPNRFPGAYPGILTGYVTSPEDTILAKLEWYRMGGEVSDRQWRDILGVLKTRAGELDLEYLRQWAADLHVSDLLGRALKESS